jgi:HD-GYP domain-containing protein (c-di-GMP phosphodiesterase class II)
MLEAYHPPTARHAVRVHRYALQLADALGLGACNRARLGLTAKLHDIGKAHLPTAILNKPGALTVEEYRLVRQHPKFGERMLAPYIDDPVMLAGVRSHHERFDGDGYPDGLAGERIPWLGRVLAVADCFDAMTSWRPHRRPHTAGAALAILEREAGYQFDPRIVRAFVSATSALRNAVLPEMESALPRSVRGRRGQPSFDRVQPVS